MSPTATTEPTVQPEEPELVEPAARPVTVEARRLRKSFGDVEVIHGLDIVVEPGTIVGLIGPSGCGKTTTVRLLTGLLAPTSGEALVAGTPAVDLSAARRARIGYLPQTPALFPDLSLIENLSFHASMYGLPLRRRERLDELLDWVELGEHRKKRVADASGGMQRRLALAAAFVHDPDIVFLDEPTAGIDPILRDKFWNRFHEIADRGTTLVVTTQYVAEAGKCSRVGLLSDGDLVLYDSPENLRRAAYSGEVIDVVTNRPVTDAEMATLTTRAWVVGDVQRTAPDTIRIVVDDAIDSAAAVREELAAFGVEASSIDEYVVDYDEAFVRIVERHRSDGDPAADEVDVGADEADEADVEAEEQRMTEAPGGAS